MNYQIRIDLINFIYEVMKLIIFVVIHLDRHLVDYLVCNIVLGIEKYS